MTERTGEVRLPGRPSLDYVQSHSDVEIFRFGKRPVKLGGTELCGFPVDEERRPVTHACMNGVAREKKKNIPPNWPTGCIFFFFSAMEAISIGHLEVLW